MVEAFDTLLGLMRARRSVRRFRPDPVDPALLERLVEAARWAPSAGNRQSYRFYSVTDADTRRALASIVESEIEALRGELRPEARDDAERYLRGFLAFADAPLLLVAVHRAAPSLLDAALEEGRPDSRRRGEADALCSVAAAITQLLLGAHALGLGACWMTGPLIAEAALARALQVPEGWCLSALIPIGYPAETSEAPPRRATSALLRPAPRERS